MTREEIAELRQLALKKFIVTNFDQNDISTYGLTFAITNRGENKIYFTSIVIEKNTLPNIVKDFHIRPTYNVLYSENFNPNTQKYLVYAQDVDKIELPGLLMELSKLYFEKLGESDKDTLTDELNQNQDIEKEVYQCKECLTIYDSELGDKKFNIESETLFEDITIEYECPVCEAPKQSFELVTI